MQRKLTEGEIEKLKQARAAISDVLFPTYGGNRYWTEVLLSIIDDKIRHKTSDGEPWVESEPEIPPGWRKAFDYEYGRIDIKIWDFSQKIWVNKLLTDGDFVPGNIYIVPVDPPLTDEDACVIPRLLVMVRDRDGEPWVGPCKYLGKTESCYAVEPGNGGDATCWNQARRATLEEIEATARK